MNFPSVRGGQGLSKGRQGLGERGGGAGGLEQGSWGLGRVSKGLGGWGLERAEGLGSGGGAGPSGDQPDGRSLVRLDGRTENSPLCAIGHRPLRVCCPKREGLRGGEGERGNEERKDKGKEKGETRERGREGEKGGRMRLTGKGKERCVGVRKTSE